MERKRIFILDDSTQKDIIKFDLENIRDKGKLKYELQTSFSTKDFQRHLPKTMIGILYILHILQKKQ